MGYSARRGFTNGKVSGAQRQAEIQARIQQMQEKVSAAIENMTGLVVLDVNIRVAGVNMNEG